MLALKPTLLSLGFIARLAMSQSHGEEASEEMGPVAIMWPPDRLWGADFDNHAPCGSAEGVGNRTEFPLLNGVVSLVAQDESWQIAVAISYAEHPSSNDDFEEIIEAHRIPSLNSGHECYPVPNPGPDVEPGTNATLQIKYTSDFGTDLNETFYACSDITYVATSQFTTQVPCFNATVDDFTISDGADNSTSTGTGSGASATSGSVTASSSGGGLSGGAIAGIVVGVVVGVGAFVGLLVYAWSRNQQNKRLRDQQNNVRGVKWQDAARGSASESSNRDIPLRDV
ncbi:hypothetical protein B0A52_05132 [Exophiala mesophila]|uniref:Copper acquisition factor BIM1-like domain-containing protein n=1 Tax=Exophiala mesophila TaxID=212818 RepID=A0A438N744_EXOME|nr:hypothetical protein B0A52_05132 [Exophiala mesophila]